MLLLLRLALAVGMVSPPETPPADEVPPAGIETSPTAGGTPAAADVAPAPESPPTTPETPPATPETPPATPETPPATPETPPSAPPPAPAPAADAPPGGYWSLAEQHERSREPLDGEDELTIGSVLFSLGALRAGAGLLTVWMASNPEQCPLTEPQACSGLRNYGWVGVAEGGLMLGTGITYLVIGATRRERHRRWERGEPLALRRPSVTDLGPWLIPRAASGPSEIRVGGAGLRLQLRF